ncbi:Serine/threonine-protein kinase ATG1 [Bienertia sinuspersici]
MATIQPCKPVQVDPSHKDQTKHQKIAPSNEKKHHFFFWQKHGNDEQKIEHKNEKKTENPINNKHQHQQNVVGHPNNEHKNGQVSNTNKQRNEVSVTQPRGQHKLRQCFGHGAGLAGSDTEETETIVIERKIKERVVISHARKPHDHKDGDHNKHLERC